MRSPCGSIEYGTILGDKPLGESRKQNLLDDLLCWSLFQGLVVCGTFAPNLLSQTVRSHSITVCYVTRNRVEGAESLLPPVPFNQCFHAWVESIPDVQ